MPKYSPQPPVDGIPANPWNPHVWITGEPKIGENTSIGPFSLIDGQGGLTIGKGCQIGSGVSVLTHNTFQRCTTGRVYDKIEKAETLIEDYVHVGEHATILMGARIGHHSVITPGTLVKRFSEIPPYSLVSGVPGRIVRSLQDEIAEWALKAVGLFCFLPAF